MRKSFKGTVFALLRFSGVPFLARELGQRRKVTIIVFHDLPLELADAHFNVLRRCYNCISLAEFLTARADQSMHLLPPKALIITFDDGHRGNFALMPVLRKHQLPITIFLCSGIVGTRRHYWWCQVGDPAEAQMLKSLPDEVRAQRLLKHGHNDDREYETRQALSADEIRGMRDIVDFQSHTVFHPILPACSDARATTEVVESKRALETGLGLKIHALAYPNGDYSQREIELLRNSGYACGLTLDPGSNDAGTDLFCLRRVALPDNADINEIIVKTSGTWAILKGLAEVLRGRSRRKTRRMGGRTSPTAPMRDAADRHPAETMCSITKTPLQN